MKKQSTDKAIKYILMPKTFSNSNAQGSSLRLFRVVKAKKLAYSMDDTDFNIYEIEPGRQVKSNYEFETKIQAQKECEKMNLITMSHLLNDVQNIKEALLSIKEAFRKIL